MRRKVDPVILQGARCGCGSPWKEICKGCNRAYCTECVKTHDCEKNRREIWEKLRPKPSYDYSIIDMKLEKVPPLSFCEKTVDRIFKRLGIVVMRKLTYVFNPPKAYTIVWILGESHALIHSFPEASWLELVVATCGPVSSHDLLGEVRGRFAPVNMTVKEVKGCVPS